ncbi:ThiF family adenylyltransferase [Paenibacillus sp. D9]|uniref:ThiF family adenylyltransferase n=1 Tax=Paenibacillus sp. D9 TaxID=665792 RepID=UPI000675CC4E|nr:ThiF family adenylyltransferase [Paenibacillus sp. D9]
MDEAAADRSLFRDESPSSSIRYARQIRFAPVGEAGQTSLASSRAAVAGMGALGCVIASHLVRSGVGEVVLIDRDIVEWSNLQRQMLYSERDAALGTPKAAAAAARLREANSSVRVFPAIADLTPGSAESLLAGADIIVDGTDNFSARYLINDYAVKHGIPWVYGGAVASGGMTMTVIPGETPCYRCLYPAPPAGGIADTCETAGVLSPLVDIVGSLQAMEAIKWLTGNRQAMSGSLLQLDVWRNSWMQVSAGNARREDCPCCGQGRFAFLEEPQQESSAVMCGRSTVQVTPSRPLGLDLSRLASRLESSGRAELGPYSLRYRSESGLTVIIFPDGRALVQGTQDPIKAKGLYTDILGD